MTQFHDSAFPDLADALDASKMLEVIGASGASSFSVDGWDRCKVVDVRGAPGQRWRVTYELSSGTGDDQVKHHLYGELLGPSLLSVNPSHVGPVLVTDSPAMEFHRFPRDPELPWLPDLMDPAIASAIVAQLGLAPADADVSVTVLHYAPRERATLQFDVSGSDPRELIGKTDSSRRARSLFMRASQIYQVLPSGLTIPEPLSYADEHHLVLHEKVAGVPMSSIVGSERFPEALRSVAISVAALHALPVDSLVPKNLAKFIKILTRSADLINVVMPDLGVRACRLVSKIEPIVCEGTVAVRTTHSDFHMGNILVDRDRVVLIDLDEVVPGDPLVDVGRFLALIQSSALRRYGSLSALDDEHALFREQYERSSGVMLDGSRLRAIEAGSLVRNAAFQFTQQAPDWQGEVESVLEAAEQVMGPL